MADLGAKLTEKMIPSYVFEIGGIPITDTIVTMWLIMAFLIIASLILTRKLSLVPSKSQSYVEATVEFVNNLCKQTIGHHWRGFAPYIGTVLLFLMIGNIIAIFNIIPHFNNFHYALRPPAKDITVPACFALISILLVIGAQLRYKKPKGFVKSFFEPIPAMFPFKIMDYIVRPLTLCLRLFGNILAAFTIMELTYIATHGVTSWIFPTIVPSFLSLYFDIFDGLLQAFIFSFLTTLYIGEAIE